eukprot:m.1517932 g.1517932  ORF g.1517932 m.1517932 type:complete len:62 (+) comp25219_c0_seq9:2599-2784(+)
MLYAQRCWMQCSRRIQVVSTVVPVGLRFVDATCNASECCIAVTSGGSLRNQIGIVCLSING